MSFAKIIIVKESLSELRTLQRNSSALVAKRIRVLIEIKKAGDLGLSKRLLAEQLGVNHNSIQTWRSLYEQGGIEALCTVQKKSPKPSILNTKEHLATEIKLKDPKNGLRGYVELKQWIAQEFNKDIKYNTLLKYCIRHFGSKVKVARKSHVRKNEQVVDAFKKTSVVSVKKSSKKKL